MDKKLDELCTFFQLLNQTPKNDVTTEENLIILNDEEIFEDIRNFNNFVRKYGHTGGWDDIDHSIFVNLTRKHNLQSVIHQLRRNFPDISEEDIIEHDKWYKQFLKLKSLQQRAFKFWNIKKKDNDDKSRPSTASTTVSSRTNYSMEGVRRKRDDLKIKIQKWKEYKKQTKQNEEKLNAIKAQEEIEKEKINKIRQENMRKSLTEYREEKKQIQKALWLAKLVEENEKIKITRKKANRMLPFFRKKDERIIRKLQEQRKLNEKKAKEQELLLEKMVSKYRKTIKVERDPLRLLSPTVEWRQKILGNTEDIPDTNIFPDPHDITNIPHLAVPSWRKNIQEYIPVIEKN